MPNVDTTLAGGSIERMAESARRAEELGFAGLVTAEASHEPYLPLMIAAELNHAAAADLLLARGADKSIKDKQGKTAGDLTSLTALRDKLAAAPN